MSRCKGTMTTTTSFANIPTAITRDGRRYPTNTGGLPEIVQNELTGYVVTIVEPEALAHAVLRLLESPSMRTSFGSLAKRRVESLFAPALTAKKIETIYNQVA